MTFDMTNPVFKKLLRWSLPLSLAASLLLSTSHVTAEISEQAREIMEAYNQATGGTEAKKGIERIHYSGRWEIPDREIEGPCNLWIEEGEKVALLIDIPDLGTIKNCYVDGIGWVEHPQMGAHQMDERQANQTLQSALIFPEANIDKYYQSGEVQESPDPSTDVLRLIDYNGDAQTWVFDKNTFLLKETTIVIDEGVRGSFKTVQRLDNYREIKGILYPLSLVWKNPANELHVELSEIELNPVIPGHIFQMPEVIKKSLTDKSSRAE